MDKKNNQPKILCIIPARGGSKGVPRKNIKPLAGIPLIGYTIKAILDSQVISKLVVSTEDDEIAEVAQKYGAQIIKRPDSLALDTTLTEPVMQHALDTLKNQGEIFDFISLVQCTSPFLNSGIIKKCVDKVVTQNFDSCLTAFVPHGYEFKWTKKDNKSDIFIPEHDVQNRPRRQDLPALYHENGAFYITKAELFKKTKNRFGGNLAKVSIIEMTELNSLQIDNLDDIWLAEQILKK